MAKAIMIQGTMSNAGKSIITTALCRIFKQDGYKVAPFKSQNMALNSFITEEGLEMGRAQVAQAEAAGVKPSVLMNPILLKPTTDVGSQVIVKGEIYGNMTAAEYYAHKEKLRQPVLEAYAQLDQEYDIIVIEGAGSPAEINLKDKDLVNMGMAKMAKAPVLLVGDIDRGGVFAQLYGTLALLEPEERQMVKGLLVNKFRGDETILQPGIEMLKERLAPMASVDFTAVIPYVKVDIDDEDSLADRFAENTLPKQIDIAVLKLPKVSNFTDLNAFQRFESVSLRYVSSVAQLQNPDLVIVPGTKSTLADLRWMRQNGLEAAVLKLHAQGTPVFGICGGYQILGETLTDPFEVEGGGTHRGMGLLPNTTVFAKEKTRTQVQSTLGDVTGVLKNLTGMDFAGYEIHMGVTENKKQPYLDCGDNCYGTYIHGIFDKGNIAWEIITALAKKKGIDLQPQAEFDLNAYKEQQYNKLAEVVRSALDMPSIYQILQQGIE